MIFKIEAPVGRLIFCIKKQLFTKIEIIGKLFDADGNPVAYGKDHFAPSTTGGIEAKVISKPAGAIVDVGPIFPLLAMAWQKMGDYFQE